MVRLHVFSSGRIGHTMAKLSITNDNAPPCIQSEIGTSVLYIYIYVPECIEMFGRDPSGFKICTGSHFYFFVEYLVCQQVVMVLFFSGQVMG